MKFVTIREFRSNTAAVRKQLGEDKYLVLTANGKPFGILSHVEPDDLEEEWSAIRRARAHLALDRLQQHAKARGVDNMSMDEVDRIIAQARRDREAESGSGR